MRSLAEKKEINSSFLLDFYTSKKIINKQFAAYSILHNPFHTFVFFFTKTSLSLKLSIAFKIEKN